MKQILSILLFIICSTIAINALPVDSIITEYKDGIFITQYLTEIDVSEDIIEKVTDRLVNDFHDSSADLFKWALKDLGLQNQNNELIISLQSSNHDEKTGITHGLFNIDVPYFTTFRNIKVDAIVSKKRNNDITSVTANIIYSSLLLDNGLATLYVIPKKNNKLYFYTHFSIKFGWFFNIFITKKRYKSIVEWRVKKFTDNMKNECKSLELKKK